MRTPYELPLWKTAPLIRLLLPLIAGIILQWYLHLSLFCILVFLLSFLAALLLLYFLKGAAAFYVRRLQGFLLYLLIGVLGSWLAWQKDIRQSQAWYGHHLHDSIVLVAKIIEPLSEKAKSYKAEAIVTHVVSPTITAITRGKILLYFAKDSTAAALRYGQVVLLNKKPQGIRSSGNPGAFDYKQYAAFQQIHHQVFLKAAEWQPSGSRRPNPFRLWLYESKSAILGILKKYVGDSNHELGIAEALLIGYKEDLDKKLVQAYSNTGVVHIIAISGLHLGLIFFVLTWTFNRTPWLKKSRHVKVLLLLGCLWVFALLTGGSASVLRSAVMFTVIVIGKYYFKQSSVYSSLSASAFLLLCYNPYYLWDVGFQLSYLAVIGIVAVQQPLYRLLYFKNRVCRSLWNMASITIAAQLATFPVCLLYFHQFPNFFLFTNMLTVPLSTVILFTEVLMVIVSPISPLAHAVGGLVTLMITAMNRIILFFDGVPFAMVERVYADINTTWLLYAVLLCGYGWWVRKTSAFRNAAVIFFCSFSVLHAFAALAAQRQQKLIIYNVPKCRAVDFISGRSFTFLGDSALHKDPALVNFHLRSSRISYHATKASRALWGLGNNGGYWQFGNRKFLFLDSSRVLPRSPLPFVVDVLLLSHNARIRIIDVLPAVNVGVIVADASNTAWQIQRWKKESEALNLRFHSVSEQGAFILDVREFKSGDP